MFWFYSIQKRIWNFLNPYFLKLVFKYISGSQLGVRVPLGVREKLTGGTPNFKNNSKQVYLGRIIDLGVRKGGTILIWGYTEGYNPDLGVHEYQKVENPWNISKSEIV